jgi:hypothetical protein
MLLCCCCRDPYIAFKNFQAGSNGASSVDRNTTRAKETDYGNYGWHRTPDALSVGEQIPAANAATFTRFQQCTDACDVDRRCVGITIQQIVPNDPTVGYNNAGPKSCKVVYANVRPGTNKRSMIRVDTTAVAIPLDLIGGLDSAVTAGCALVPTRPIARLGKAAAVISANATQRHVFRPGSKSFCACRIAAAAARVDLLLLYVADWYVCSVP